MLPTIKRGEAWLSLIGHDPFFGGGGNQETSTVVRGNIGEGNGFSFFGGEWGWEVGHFPNSTCLAACVHVQVGISITGEDST